MKETYLYTTAKGTRYEFSFDFPNASAVITCNDSAVYCDVTEHVISCDNYKRYILRECVGTFATVYYVCIAMREQRVCQFKKAEFSDVL